MTGEEGGFACIHSAAAGAGFLLAVLWFDLMFDVQHPQARRRTLAGRSAGLDFVLLPARHDRCPSDEPAGRPGDGADAGRDLPEIVQGENPWWIGWVSLALAGRRFVLTIVRTVPKRGPARPRQ